LEEEAATSHPKCNTSLESPRNPCQEDGRLFTTRRTHFSYSRYLELSSKKPIIL
jgi:hypothetical protein